MLLTGDASEEPALPTAPRLWCGVLDCNSLLSWRSNTGDRELYKALSSAGLAVNIGVYLYLRSEFPAMTLIGVLYFLKNMVAIWGQDTPTWLVPGSPAFFVLIYLVGIPSALWMLVGCPASCDSTLDFPHRDVVAVAMFVFGLSFSFVYEFGRFRWKKRPENKGRLHTVGLAALCVHPNYFGDLFTYNGWALAGGTKCAFGLSLFQLSLFVWFVIPNADAYLAKRYPDEFPAYADNTATLIPFLRSPLLNHLLAAICCAGSVYASIFCTERCVY